MSQSKYFKSSPKSLRKKRILDVAAADPEASLESIASEIPSVTPDLVKRVLETYGDPGDGVLAESLTADEAADAELEEEQERSPVEETESTESEPDTPAEDAGSDAVTLDEFSEAQRAVLRAIHEHPGATQRDIGEVLDVSAATVCNRVNAIADFDWKHRHEFTKRVFGTEPTATAVDESPMRPAQPKSSSLGKLTARVTTIEQQIQTLVQRAELEPEDDELTARVTTIEQQIETVTQPDQPDLVDTALAHKVIRECIQSDDISEEEELEILETLLGSGA